MAGVVIGAWDRWGLWFTVAGGTITVHFPRRDPNGDIVHGGGAGIPIDHRPELDRDGIRAALFRRLLVADRERRRFNPLPILTGGYHARRKHD